MNKLAILNPTTGMFEYTNTPDKAISDISSMVEGISIENTIFLEKSVISHLYSPNYSMNQAMDMIYNEFDNMKQIHEMGKEYAHSHSVVLNRNDEGKLPFHIKCLDLLRKGKTEHSVRMPLRIKYPYSENTRERYLHKFKYEIDMYAATLSLLFFNYYLSTVDEGHAEAEGITNPLKDVHGINMTKKYGIDSFEYASEEDEIDYYLCSNLSMKYSDYNEAIQNIQMLVEILDEDYGFDTHRIVHTFFLSGIYLALTTFEKEQLLESAAVLQQLATESLGWKTENFGIPFKDGMLSNERYDKTSPNLFGEYITKSTETEYISIDMKTIEPSSLAIAFSKLDNHDIGWYTFSPADLIGKKEYVGKRMYHIDISHAYTNVFNEKTGVYVDKKEFGKVKCVDIYTYQQVRLEVKERSEELTSDKDFDTIYWRTDGGIVVTDNYESIRKLAELNPDVRVEEILTSTPLVLDNSIKLPSYLENKAISSSRIFGYDITYRDFTGRKVNEAAPTVTKFFEANTFDTKMCEDILKFNGLQSLISRDFNIIKGVLSNS